MIFCIPKHSRTASYQTCEKYNTITSSNKKNQSEHLNCQKNGLKILNHKIANEQLSFIAFLQRILNKSKRIRTYNPSGYLKISITGLKVHP